MCIFGRQKKKLLLQRMEHIQSGPFPVTRCLIIKGCSLIPFVPENEELKLWPPPFARYLISNVSYPTQFTVTKDMWRRYLCLSLPLFFSFPLTRMLGKSYICIERVQRSAHPLLISWMEGRFWRSTCMEARYCLCTDLLFSL